MYQKWAKKRRMHLKVLHEEDGEGIQPYNFIMAVSGFGAYSILKLESGVHVFETPKAEKSFQRHNIRVRVVAQPEIPEQEEEAFLAQARDAFAREEVSATVIVRRYRQEPSPLVRDSIRKWRTGRIDRVLDGDFDLVG